MPEKFTKFLTGPGIASVQFFGVSALATDGTPTYTTAVNYITQWRNFRLNVRPEKRNIRPSSIRGANNQITGDDYSITLGGYILDQTGVTAAIPAPILNAFYLYDNFKVIVVRAGVSGTYYVSRGEGSEEYGRDEDVEEFTFDRVEVGTVNPLYASVL